MTTMYITNGEKVVHKGDVGAYTFSGNRDGTFSTGLDLTELLKSYCRDDLYIEWESYGDYYSYKISSWDRYEEYKKDIPFWKAPFAKTVEVPAVSEVSRLKKDHKALVRRVEDLELVLEHSITTSTPDLFKKAMDKSSVKEYAEWIRKLT